MAVQACETYGYQVSDQLKEIFTKYHKTHNTAVFDAYTPEMMKVRHNKILTGLPDTYGRGRIVGDYRRVALYGIDHLIEEKKKDKANCGCGEMTDNVIRLREEIAEQIKCLRGYEEACRDLRIRYFQTCNKRKGSRTVVILRIPCSNQDTERCSNVRWSCFHLP